MLGKNVSAPNLMHSLDQMDRLAIMKSMGTSPKQRTEPMANLDTISSTKPSLVVRIWPDGTSVLKEYYTELGFAHMSDDYIDVDLYDFEQIAKARTIGIDMYAIIEEYIGEDPITEHA